jgi:hypothetical protein
MRFIYAHITAGRLQDAGGDGAYALGAEREDAWSSLVRACSTCRLKRIQSKKWTERRESLITSAHAGLLAGGPIDRHTLQSDEE